MRARFVIAGVCVLGALTGLSACGSSGAASSGTGASSSSSVDACISSYASGLGAPSGCIPCAEAQCASELASLASACSAFFACACPGGTFSATASNGATCQADLSESTCATEKASFESSCIGGTCETECSGNATSPTGSGSSSSG